MDKRQVDFRNLVDRLRKSGGLVSQEEIMRRFFASKWKFLKIYLTDRIENMHREMMTESTDNCFSLASLAKPNISKTGWLCIFYLFTYLFAFCLDGRPHLSCGRIDQAEEIVVSGPREKEARGDRPNERVDSNRNSQQGAGEGSIFVVFKTKGGV